MKTNASPRTDRACRRASWRSIPASAPGGRGGTRASRAYTTGEGVSGNLTAIGSDTLNNLMTLWSEAFKKQYPKVKIQVEGKGSTTAPPALIAGTAQLGPMSRLMKPEEIDGFREAVRLQADRGSRRGRRHRRLRQQGQPA